MSQCIVSCCSEVDTKQQLALLLTKRNPATCKFNIYANKVWEVNLVLYHSTAVLRSFFRDIDVTITLCKRSGKRFAVKMALFHVSSKNSSLYSIVLTIKKIPVILCGKSVIDADSNLKVEEVEVHLLLLISSPSSVKLGD